MSVALPGPRAWCIALFRPLAIGMSLAVAAADDTFGEPAIEASTTTSAAEWLARYQDAESLAQLCEQCRQQNIAMDARHRALEHTETALTFELDKNDQTVAAEKGVDRVWFEGDDEYRQTIEKRDHLTGSEKKFDARPKKSPRADTIYPMTHDAQPDMYVYSLEDCQIAEGEPVLRIGFQPLGSLDGKLRGTVWVNPRTFHSLRFEGDVVKLPRLVNETKVSIEFGPAENGEIQTRRTVIRVSGGLALIQKRYRIETDHHTYQAPKTDR